MEKKDEKQEERKAVFKTNRLGGKKYIATA